MKGAKTIQTILLEMGMKQAPYTKGIIEDKRLWLPKEEVVLKSEIGRVIDERIAELPKEFNNSSIVFQAILWELKNIKESLGLKEKR